MEERVELETVRVVLGGFANTSLVPENKRPASNQARSIDSFPAALLTVPEGFRELQQSGPLLLHLHGLTEYLGTSAASTGMFQIIENHPSIKISCTCSMGLCTPSLGASRDEGSCDFNSFQRSTDNEYSWMCITNQSCMVPKFRFRLMVSVSIWFFRQLFMENFELGHI